MIKNAKKHISKKYFMQLKITKRQSGTKQIKLADPKDIANFFLRPHPPPSQPIGSALGSTKIEWQIVCQTVKSEIQAVKRFEMKNKTTMQN